MAAAQKVSPATVQRIWDAHGLQPHRTETFKLSRDKHLPVSDIVRDAVRRHVAVERFRALRAMAVPHAQKAGYFTDEDIFKAVS